MKFLPAKKIFRVYGNVCVRSLLVYSCSPRKKECSRPLLRGAEAAVLPVQGSAVAELLASFTARYDRFQTSLFGFDSEMLTDCYRQLSFTSCL